MLGSQLRRLVAGWLRAGSENGNGIATVYPKRRNGEPDPKSLKPNALLEKSSTKIVRTQSNHFNATLCGYIKLELLKRTAKLDHFALKSKLYLQAMPAAYATLRELKPAQLGA